MRNPVEVELLTRVFTGHLYSCNQRTDPCFNAGRRLDIAGHPIETWHDAASRVAGHLAEVVADAIGEDDQAPAHVCGDPRCGL